MMDAGWSPAAVAARLVELFPRFAEELELEREQGKEIANYHHLIQILAPVINGYLKESPERTVKRFCDLVNLMTAAGGEMENAISTCLLEHASQLRLRQLLRPYLSPASRRELR